MPYENTSVPVSKSQEDIRKLLTRHRASQFRFSEGEGADDRWWAGVEFVHDGHLVRIIAPLRDLDECQLSAKLKRARTRTLQDFVDEFRAQESKRIWRLIWWSLKARMEAVEGELETFEQAFASHLVDPASGQTLWQFLSPYIESGAMQVGGSGLPQLLAGPSHGYRKEAQ